MKLSDIWSKIGKQPLRITQHKEAIVFIDDDKYFVTGIEYDSGKILGFNAVPIQCSTCVCQEKDIPHTCDLCTSLDNDEEYTMWSCK